MENLNQFNGNPPQSSFPFTPGNHSKSACVDELEIRFRDQKGTYKLRFNLNPEVRARRGGGRRIP